MTFLVKEAHHLQLFKHQRSAFAEHHFTLRLALRDFIAKLYRSHLLTGDGRVGSIFRQTQSALNTAGFARLI